ncbi:hypothetical protein AOR_1_994194 [Paecilomyces variotii No. 5]|uniref:Methyltransferase domain-containing protein n=1 Tax=Byssochlamys spectabilis (strain No. 5 / NBRC 109023) TaxID=1356009 RepID=V5G1Z4_BYSSN|nr:hypothetical protein AOR_1_994194 [Paecilomyces variotii No. 5]
MQISIQDTLAERYTLNANPPSRPVQYMETVDAYDKWAEVYDTDNNFLQALDSIEMETLLPDFLTRVQSSQHRNDEALKLIDLGCGTGRNTLRLRELCPARVQMIGLDNSRGMLDVARKRLQVQEEKDPIEGDRARVLLDVYDLLQSPPAPPTCAIGALGVISTLVLEHIPVEMFFEGASALLAPGGLLLVTNMHSEMGTISQAGFVDVATGMKIRPTSYNYTVEEVIQAARRTGLEVVGDEAVKEKAVDENMLEVLGPRAKKWVGVKVWFAICFRKKE